MSVFLFMTALSSAIGEAFVCELPPSPLLFHSTDFSSALSSDPLLVWNYGVMGVLAGVSGIAFWWSVRDLDHKEDELNNLDEGHVHTTDSKRVDEREKGIL